MKIGISLFQFFPGRVGGAGEYIARVVPRLLDCLDVSDRLFLCGSPVNLAAFADLQDERLVRVVFPVSRLEISALRLADLILPGIGGARFAARINALHLDVMLFPQQSLFPFGLQAKKVVTVVDLLHERFPQQFGGLARAIRRRKDRQLTRHSDCVICISEATRTDLLDYQRLSPERAVVVRLGGNDRPPLGSPPPAIGEPYLFYPANAYPHKNHAALLRAFQRFRSEHPDLPGRLILCGLVQPQLARALRECRPEARIEHVGYVSRERLAALYADCTAVLIPSLFEGFGIPLIEAMGYGKKIFCAELPVFRELAGDAVEYFDATSEAAIAAQCARIFSRPAWPVDRAAYAGILAELNWEQCARQTYELLSEVAASRPAIAAEAQRRAA